jgi:ribosomal protein S18 acetylase RimI-like enzyme
MPVGTRPIKKEDRGSLEAALRSDETFTDEEVAVALELIDGALSGGESGYQVRVALDGEEGVLGYICFGRTPMTEATYDLYWLVTHKRARGQGVATLLVKEMERELKALGRCAVRVETSHKESYGAARSFYERCGYPEHARFSDFYRPGDDLVVYYKQL